MARDAAKRVLLPIAALALAATAAAGCKPPIEQSEFINSGLSAAVAEDASKAPPTSANPPPNIVVPPQESASVQAAVNQEVSAPAKNDSGVPPATPATSSSTSAAK